MAVDEDPPAGIPEWVVTFGDMMSLLLTFFIMLVSMSELKQEERFQAMLESMRRQFGYDESAAAIIPGNMKEADSSLAALAPAATRSQRKNLLKGGNDEASPPGDKTRVQDIRRGRAATSGGVIVFAEDSAQLTEANKQDLAVIATRLAGKAQKIEIRGHTSRHPVNSSSGVRDHWDLAFTRSYNTMQHLVQLGIEPERIRIGSAAAHEPIDQGLSADERKRNARVEVLLWDERVGEQY